MLIATSDSKGSGVSLCMSDTPRTDAHAGFVLDSTPVHCQSFDPTPDGTYVPVDFARELERECARLQKELNEARYTIEQLNDVLHA